MFQMPIDGRLRWVRKDSRASSIARGIDESLQRLGIETIDLMQIHHLDVDTRLEDSLAELVKAKESGKILAIGVSNFPAAEVARSRRFLDGELASVQDELNLISTDRSSGLLDLCRQSSIRFLAYSPLARGVLAGKHLAADLSSSVMASGASYMAPVNLRKINDILRTIVAPIAAAHEASLAQVCLAWALAQPGVTDVVAGATSESQAIENAGVMRLAIPPETFARMTAAVAASQLDLSLGPPPGSRLRRQVLRIRRFAGRVLRRFR
jgi:aryl-alcohol dehydrogenase-like predicted oxidoreductase